MASQESVAKLSVDNGLIEIEDETPKITYQPPTKSVSRRTRLQTSPMEGSTYIVEHIHDTVRKEERRVEISRGLKTDDNDEEYVGHYQLKPGQEGHSFVGPRMKNPLRKPYPPHTDSVCPMNTAIKRQLEAGGDTSALEVPECDADRDVFTTDIEVPVKVQRIVPRRRIVKKVVKRPIFVPIEEISYQDVPRVERRLVRQKRKIRRCSTFLSLLSVPIWLGQPPS